MMIMIDIENNNKTQNPFTIKKLAIEGNSLNLLKYLYIFLKKPTANILPNSELLNRKNVKILWPIQKNTKLREDMMLKKENINIILTNDCILEKSRRA